MCVSADNIALPKQYCRMKLLTNGSQQKGAKKIKKFLMGHHVKRNSMAQSRNEVCTDLVNCTDFLDRRTILVQLVLHMQ